MSSASQTPEPEALVAALRERGVAGVQVGWVDNNGIVRSRVVPLAGLPAALHHGVGITTAFGVFDSHDGITFAHDGLSTPSGDVRLVPVVERIEDVVPLAGQPGLAWVPGRQVDVAGETWPYCQRAVLERQMARAAEAGFGVRAGWEIEVVLVHDDAADGGQGAAVDGRSAGRPAMRGPAYSANAVRDVHEVLVRLLRDLESHGVEVGQAHAEYGGSQLELTLAATDPLAICDAQVLARQTIHDAARAHGLRASLAPITTLDGAGNGWHLHTSLTDLASGRNALTGNGAHGLSAVGEGYLAGLLAELPGLVAVTAPSTGSLLRRRPGYWAGAFGFWGVENREAALRLVPASPLLGPEQTNVELKACDASANPYLALATVIGAGLAGVAAGATPPEPVQEDVGTWPAVRREAHGISPLATTHEEQRAHLLASEVVREVLGEPLLGAFTACRDADAAWAADHDDDQVVASLRWQY